jgi:hypothetical protein
MRLGFEDPDCTPVEALEGGAGALSLLVESGPACGAMLPPEVSAELKAGVHVVRIEEANPPPYTVVVSASPVAPAESRQ